MVPQELAWPAQPLPLHDRNTQRTTDLLLLTHNDGTFFASEAFLDAFLEGIKYNLQQVAGSQGHGLVFHAQDGDHTPSSQHTQGCHRLGGREGTEPPAGAGQPQGSLTVGREYGQKGKKHLGGRPSGIRVGLTM